MLPVFWRKSAEQGQVCKFTLKSIFKLSSLKVSLCYIFQKKTFIFSSAQVSKKVVLSTYQVFLGFFHFLLLLENYFFRKILKYREGFNRNDPNF